MKFNDREIALLSEGKSDLEGRLNYSRLVPSNIYGQSEKNRDRLFKLKGNLLFYFRFSSDGKADLRQPVGVLVLENCCIQPEADASTPFALSIVYNEESDRKHILSGRSESSISEWIRALQTASYEHWRLQLLILQRKINHHTGKDPLLMVPRNDGSRRNLTWSVHKQPSSQTAQPSNFKCHLPGAHNLSAPNLTCQASKNLTSKSYVGFNKEDDFVTFPSEGESADRECDKILEKYKNMKTSKETTWESTPTFTEQHTSDPFDFLNKQGLIFSETSAKSVTVTKSKSSTSVIASSIRTNPFGAPNTTTNGELLAIAPPPSHTRRQRTSKNITRSRTDVVDATDIFDPCFSNTGDTLVPTPPARKRSPKHSAQNGEHVAQFYIEDGSEDVTFNPIYQSTVEVVQAVKANGTVNKDRSENLIQF